MSHRLRHLISRQITKNRQQLIYQDHKSTKQRQIEANNSRTWMLGSSKTTMIPSKINWLSSHLNQRNFQSKGSSKMMKLSSHLNQRIYHCLEILHHLLFAKELSYQLRIQLSKQIEAKSLLEKTNKLNHKCHLNHQKINVESSKSMRSCSGTASDFSEFQMTRRQLVSRARKLHGLPLLAVAKTIFFSFQV